MILSELEAGKIIDLNPKDFIDNDAPLLIFNSDQLIEYDARITYSIFKNIHGGIQKPHSF